MEPFPVGCLTPKRETGILSFLSKRPLDDGRGNIIAILDSGVDPAAPGLRVTSHGLPKVIERYDCSGSGDVDTSTVNSVDTDGVLVLASGLKLKVPEEWAKINGTGKYHCGVKPLYEMYTPKLKERIEKRRKEKNWDPYHRLASAAATNAIIALPTGSPSAVSVNNNENSIVVANGSSIQSGCNEDSSNPDALSSNPDTENTNSDISMLSSSSSSDLSKLEKEEAEAKIEALDVLEKKYKDWGDIIDCVLFQDSTSQRWKVGLILDPANVGAVKLMEEYKFNQDWIELTPEDKMTISVNVWEDGNKLEIVGICGSHGTHVSSIAAAYFDENPTMNGVAPGAQIISLSIGDGRLDTMETMTALSRAIAFLNKNNDRVDVINMSYGEHAHWGNNGRIGKLIKDTVDKYGIPWVASAGNHGPALSTVGTPPWLCSSVLIGVGAYVSPDMCSSEYSLRDKLPSMPYTWSSRGPSMDGDIGVTVSAPGGAITSVPNFTLRNSQLMNGTSMAAPHVTGVIALVLSAAKREGIKYSPFSIKRAMENSASRIENSDAHSVGAGLIQVEPMLEKLALYSDVPERDVRFQIGVGGSAKGIYIRDSNFAHQKEFSVTVEPEFLDSDNIDPEAKINFRLNLTLVSNQSWCSVPTFLDLSNIQRTFNARIDLEGLSSGVYHARIDAFDAHDTARGPVFSVHATAIVPHVLEPNNRTLEFPQVSYEPGLLKRYFLRTPRGATQGVLTLKNTAVGRSVRIVVHAMILLSGQSCKSDEFYKMVLLAPGEESIQTFKVQDEKVMEVVIGRWWAEPKEPVAISSSITFKSLILEHTPPSISYSATDSFYKVPMISHFQSEEVTPTLSLKNQVCVLRPTMMKLNGLSSPRDTFPNSRVIYELVATYNFNVAKASTAQIDCPLLSSTLYESEYESQLWLLFDNFKRYIGSGDAYPTKWSSKVEKGDYTLRFHVRHEKRELLEKFMNSNGSGNFPGDSLVPTLPLLISFKLATNIALPVYQSLYDVQGGSSKKGSGWTAIIKRNIPFTIFLGSCVSDKNLKQLPCSLPTHYLSGTLSLQKDEKKFGIPVQLILPEAPPKLKASSSTEKSKEDLMDQMRDVKLSWMTKLDPEESVKLYNELLEAYPTYINVLTTRLTVLDTQKKDEKDERKKEEIITEMKELFDKIIALIDKSTLLQYFGSKTVDNNSKNKSLMERSRSAYAEALVKKGLLMDECVDECWHRILEFYDPSDAKVVDLTIKHALKHEHYGRALKYLLKSEESVEKDKKILDIFNKLSWKHGIWLWNIHLHFKSCMKDFRLF